MNNKSPNINKLSPHLFWDVDSQKLDFQKNKKLIIQRTLEYGLISDWNIIIHHYGITEMAKTATLLKDLDKKSVSFISLLSGIPKEEFLCYSTKQSIPKHWNF